MAFLNDASICLYKCINRPQFSAESTLSIRKIMDVIPETIRDFLKLSDHPDNSD